MPPRISICHITPHLGGGVGSVVMCWMRHAPEYQHHTILCLDKNKNADWQEINNTCSNITIIDDAWKGDSFTTVFKKNIEQADLVVIHWWNHPLLYNVLLNYSWPPCRLIAWNHVSGLHAPYVVSEEMVQFVDVFVCTSPITLEHVDIPSFANQIPEKCHVIWSTVGLDTFIDLPRAQHDGFLVGYTGTVDRGKLHAQFLSMSVAAYKPDMHFVVCSGDSQKYLQSQAQEAGVSELFSFMGRVPSVLPYLAKYDIFGYPLQREHFGTCEQSLGEAMMAGCVPVVLDNPTERYIVEHEKSGLVAGSAHAYSEALQRLYFDRNLLCALSKGARERALQIYDLQPTLEAWNELFACTLHYPRRMRSYYPNRQEHYTPAQLYIAALGKYAAPLKADLQASQPEKRIHTRQAVIELFKTNPMFISASKGSVLQYLHFFPHDPTLQEWANFVTKETV